MTTLPCGGTAALNIQGYKHVRWQDHLGDALMESASLCLILSAVVVIRDTYADPFYAGWITFLAIMVWGVDFVVRLRLSTVYLYYVNKKEMGNMALPINVCCERTLWSGGDFDYKV